MNQNLQIYHLYSQLTNGKTIADALHAFKSLKVEKASDGDEFFGTFGVPFFTNIIQRPLEILISYEFLLQEMKKIDEKKFYKMHKGTCYFFFATTAFDIGDYEKAVFYLDSAFAEDVRKSEELGAVDPIIEAFANPGGDILRLEPKITNPALRIINKLRDCFEEELSSFKTRDNIAISREDLVKKFVIDSIHDEISNRSIVTTLYTFIFEFEDRYKLLNLRSGQKGSIEPFLVHLFKGGLIFESLLKIAAKKNSFRVNQKRENGRIIDIADSSKYKQIKTIGNFNFCKEFKKKYCELETKEELSELILLPQVGLKNAFNVTYNLRNITGHDLGRDDIFQDPDEYKKLFRHEMSAILHIIYKEFIKK